VEYESPYGKMKRYRLARALFWHTDIVGIIFLIIIFAGILVPFTIAGNKPEQWREAKVLAPLIIGLLFIPVWLYWEKEHSLFSLLPFKVSCL
jgi:SIT family siderophore-iron:H+ symporter-like MFS transporter